MKLFAVHDPWFYGLEDGDVDDRGAFRYYERYIARNPMYQVIVWIADLDRYELTIKHFPTSPIQFYHEFPRDHFLSADKVCISAPIKDPILRDQIADHLSVFRKGYCQGTKIGTTNFPSKAYEDLLESIPADHRYCTYVTNLCFPTELLDTLDPEYKHEYMAYSIMKLISPGGIVHVPGLLYRRRWPRHEHVEDPTMPKGLSPWTGGFDDHGRRVPRDQLGYYRSIRIKSSRIH